MDHPSSRIISPRATLLLLSRLLAASALATAQLPPGMFPKHQRLDRAAAALDIEDRTVAAEELYDAEMDIDHFFPEIPAFVKAALKTPVVKAEVAYWDNKSLGIHEKDIAKAFNNAVKTVKLPDEALTTEGQVKLIHEGTLRHNPQFMGRRFMHRDEATGDVVRNPRLSPIQTLHVVMALVDTKLVNEKFIVTPTEWEKYDKRHLDDPDIDADGKPIQGFHARPKADKADRMKAELYKALRQMSDSDGLLLLKDALTNLRVM